MGIYTNKRHTGLEYTACLGKCLGHHSLITLSSFLFIFVVAVHSHYCFLLFGSQKSTKMFRIEKAYTSLEPDIKEVTQVGIRYIVVVRGICYYCVKHLVA